MTPSLLAVEMGETYHRLTRLHGFVEWWQWLLLGVAVILIGLYVTWLYRRDSAELSTGLSLVLLVLRLTAFGGILFFFFVF